jgi:peptidoglycan/xylan/chitin deacetylase (PgdA/CDA1 family)
MYDYKIPILMFHRVVENKEEAGRHNIYVYRKNLIRQFEYLKKKDYKTITFRDLHLSNASQKRIILTFDDGYMDNYDLLFPLLKQYEFKAVIFLVTKQTSNKWGIDEGEPSLSLLSQEQIKEMHNYGIEFGGHSRLHYPLTQLDKNLLQNEILGCKHDIENITEVPVISFCYPFGACNDGIKRVVKESGYSYGISTKNGPDNLYEDLFQIKRIEISCRTRMSRFKTKVSGYYFKPSIFKQIFKNKSI